MTTGTLVVLLMSPTCSTKPVPVYDGVSSASVLYVILFIRALQISLPTWKSPTAVSPVRSQQPLHFTAMCYKSVFINIFSLCFYWLPKNLYVHHGNNVPLSRIAKFKVNSTVYCLICLRKLTGNQVVLQLE